MKMKVLIAVALLGMASPSFAGHPEAQQEISEIITYPEEASSENIEGLVLTTITIDELGQGTVDEIYSSDPLFENQVREIVESHQFSKGDERKVSMKIKFERR